MDPKTAQLIAEQLPVKKLYEDLCQPSIRSLGEIACEIVETIRIPLLPLTALACISQHAKDRLREKLTRLFNTVENVQKEKRIIPSPEFLVPFSHQYFDTVPEGLHEKMFASLLSKAVNTETSGSAHPDFIDLIRRLCPDEAILIHEGFLKVRDSPVGQLAKLDKKELRKQLSDCDKIGFYLSHLKTLGLVETEIYTHNEPESILDHLSFTMSPFAYEFVKRCLPEELGKKSHLNT